jgi:hypothetical protein
VVFAFRDCPLSSLICCAGPLVPVLLVPLLVCCRERI